MANKKTQPVFSKQNDLTDEQRKQFDETIARIERLKTVREDHYGVNLEQLWAEADRAYIPHRLNIGKKGKMLVQDDDKGWRGASTPMNRAQDWQSDISQGNPYVKIQTAMSILIDQNPTGIFTPGSKKYKATTAIMQALYERSWEIAKSKQQLKLFVFNLSKYGWAVARSYPLKITNQVKKLIQYNEDAPDTSKYEDIEVTEFNDIMRENLDPWNCWIDDTARPNDTFSVRDWAWRKVYPFDVAEREFGKFKNWQFVKPGGVTTEKIGGQSTQDKKYKEEKLVEVYFYENKLRDLFMVIANGVPVVIEPLPISDASGNKKLSLWQTYWTLRHAESPYGIGVYEAMRYDQAMLDRIRNMTIDQLTLSIYKMFFYQGTQGLDSTGEIKIAPGVGKQVIDPKSINWLQIPGPGEEAWKGIEMIRHDLDEVSGITDPLMGSVTGKTAFEIAQAKESALKRLKAPLDNIADALNNEAYITISLIQLLYSQPETYAITEPVLIDEYLREIKGDSELYSRSEDGAFNAHVYREFPLNLGKDERGNLIETPDSEFFRVKPRYLTWEGTIVVKAQSVLTPSKQVDKALELEMYNMLIPLLAQNPATYNKIAQSIVKLYDKDPKDILPPEWLVEPPGPQDQPLIISDPNAVGPDGQPLNPQGPQNMVQGAAGVPPAALPPGSPRPSTSLLTRSFPQGTQAGLPPPQAGAPRFVRGTQVPTQQSQGVARKAVGRMTRGSR